HQWHYHFLHLPQSYQSRFFPINFCVLFACTNFGTLDPYFFYFDLLRLHLLYIGSSKIGRRPFPEDLDGEILLRLPVKSLLRFKCVCKNWYVLIKSPAFIRKHLNCSKNKPSQFMIYDYNARDDSPPIALIPENHGDGESPDYIHRFKGMTNVIGSVDGLFLLQREIDPENRYMQIFAMALWNPSTREVRHLPHHKIQYTHCGFRLDPLTNDYKVVYYNFHCGEYEYAAVYSCSTDSCRNITPKIKFYSYGRSLHESYGTAYLNGAYYWLLSEGLKYSIVLFDFSNEVFEEIEGPDDISFSSLILLDDSVALLPFYGNCVHDIWVMIQPGVWNKRFTFQCFTYPRTWYSSCLILVTKRSRLVSYNVRTTKTRRLGFCHPVLRRNCGVYVYKESLVTLK
ncbi:F-box/kelch-repeat protein At3g06240-like, partial [Nicotiana tabacum]|uniref:F-box/kelch-repeat protein At3g06240-like n=1 Tax=Nicotiana tabacum TaxID=4097 RepID=A0A1S3YMG3_TOBAC